jgi:very-short-patch-repair endonuclease
MYEDLKKEYKELGCPTGRQLNRHKNYTKNVKDRTSWLETESTGRVEFKLRQYCIDNGITEHPMCVICGEHKVKNRGDSFTETCSKACSGVLSFNNATEEGGVHPIHGDSSSEKRKSTCVQIYGSDNPFKNKDVQMKAKNRVKEIYGVSNVSCHDSIQKKRKATMMERYGVEYASQNEDIYKKVVQTLQDRYGVDSPIKHDEFMRKIKKTIKEKYGVDHFTQLVSIQEKKKQTNLMKYGVEHYNQIQIGSDVLALLSDSVLLSNHYEIFGNMSKAAQDLNIDTSTYSKYLSMHKIDPIPSGKVSFAEKEIRTLLEEKGIEYEASNRNVLDGFEADILIEHKKIIIEYNGIYWHSELYRDRMYHQKKSLLAQEKGYTIIHVWEDDWEFKKDIIKNKILYKCGVGGERVFARECVVHEVGSSLLREFYEKNHIQGNINSSINLCLIHDEMIVAAMSFKKYKDGYDLTRFATSCSVVGGFSKLLSNFIKMHKPKNIITFASLDYSNGGLYEKNGFTREEITPPNYSYVKNGKRYSRNQFMKHLLKDKLKVFDDNLSERENMYKNGFVRLFDSGSIRYRMVL